MNKMASPSSSPVLHKKVLLIEDIKKLIPHRYPFLFVDRIENVIPAVSGTGIKCVTNNEWFFEGHFPDIPIMPGVLIVEALAQTAGALVVYSQSNKINNQQVYFLSIDNVKFRKPVVPGDILYLHVVKIHHRSNVWKFEGKALVEEKCVAEAQFKAMLANQETL